jgi:SEC-C motif
MNDATEAIPLRNRLERLGDARETWKWRSGEIDYVARLGLTAEDVPELTAIAREWLNPVEPPAEGEEDDLSVFAPIHAWRGLAQLRVPETIDVLLGMMAPLDAVDDDWYLEEFPDALAWIGPASLAPVLNYLADDEKPVYPRIAAAHALCELSRRHPEMRDDAVRAICEVLGKFQDDEVRHYPDGEDDTLNAHLIAYLLDLKATEAAELIERAYAADRVDLMVCGNWDAVRRELGVEGLGLVPKHQARRRAFWNIPSPPPDEKEFDEFGEPEDFGAFAPVDESSPQRDAPSTIRSAPKIGRNDPCPCGSGKKYKKCCGR